MAVTGRKTQESLISLRIVPDNSSNPEAVMPLLLLRHARRRPEDHRLEQSSTVHSSSRTRQGVVMLSQVTFPPLTMTVAAALHHQVSVARPPHRQAVDVQAVAAKIPCQASIADMVATVAAAVAAVDPVMGSQLSLVRLAELKSLRLLVILGP
jgi:hypothetical protein